MFDVIFIVISETFFIVNVKFSFVVNVFRESIISLFIILKFNLNLKCVLDLIFNQIDLAIKMVSSLRDIKK